MTQQEMIAAAQEVDRKVQQELEWAEQILTGKGLEITLERYKLAASTSRAMLHAMGIKPSQACKTP